jgi:MoaA/NifB/PqqE/SkfB family radical SAM enzyme
MIVVWRVTERCNLGCGFCAYDRRLPFARHDIDAGVVEAFAPLLHDYQQMTGDPVLVSWIGGETLLWQPLFRLSRWLREAFGIAASTTTNGTTLHLREVRTGILESLAELTVSVDGLAAFHDQVRNWPGGWQRLEAGVTALSRERDSCGSSLKLRANVVLMHDNLDQFGPLCDVLADWGVDEITFNQLGGRDRPEFFPAHRLTVDDARMLAETIPALQARMALLGVRLCATAPYLARIEASATNQALAVSDCKPGERFLFIDERARVAPCNFTTEQFGIPLANIGNVDDLLALPALFSDAQRQTHHPICQDCPSTRVFAKFAS